MTPVALTIAGSDPSGGAGIQADLKTFARFRVYGMAVVTLLTVQNTREVSSVQFLDPEFVIAQFDAAVDDIPPAAAKAGALGSAEMVSALARRLRTVTFPFVLDPVMVSKHGAPLAQADAVERMQSELLPQCFLVTPNLAEAAALTGRPVGSPAEMRDGARRLCDLGAHAALVKGGHLDGPPVDVLCWKETLYEFPGERLRTQNTHGTGCALSAAITAKLASGLDLLTAIGESKDWITRAIRSNPQLGHGNGPLDFFA